MNGSLAARRNHHRGYPLGRGSSGPAGPSPCRHGRLRGGSSALRRLESDLCRPISRRDRPSPCAALSACRRAEAAERIRETALSRSRGATAGPTVLCRSAAAPETPGAPRERRARPVHLFPRAVTPSRSPRHLLLPQPPSGAGCCHYPPPAGPPVTSSSARRSRELEAPPSFRAGRCPRGLG